MRHNLSDCTFLIPVRLDSIDRLVTELDPPFNGMRGSIEYLEVFFTHVTFAIYNPHVNIGLQVLNPKKLKTLPR